VTMANLLFDAVFLGFEVSLGLRGDLPLLGLVVAVVAVVDGVGGGGDLSLAKHKQKKYTILTNFHFNFRSEKIFRKKKDFLIKFC